jgi:hypothetical protein
MLPARPTVRSRLSGWARRQTRLNLGWALAVFATVAFSFAPPVARFAIVGGFDSTTLLLARMILATSFFAIVLAATDLQKLRLPRAGLAAAALVGAVNAVGMTLFFAALGQLEASLSAMILALSPPMVLSLLALRGERLTQRHLVRLALALMGVYLLIGPTGQVDWVGATLALTATFLFALQMALTQWTLIAYPTRAVAFLRDGLNDVLCGDLLALSRRAVDDAYASGLGGRSDSCARQYAAGAPGLLFGDGAHRRRTDGVVRPAGDVVERDLVDYLPERATGATTISRRRADPGQCVIGSEAAGARKSAFPQAVGAVFHFLSTTILTESDIAG